MKPSQNIKKNNKENDNRSSRNKKKKRSFHEFPLVFTFQKRNKQIKRRKKLRWGKNRKLS